MRSLLVVAAFGLLLAGCATVAINSTRNSAGPGTIEPAAFVVFQGNAGAYVPARIRWHLNSELRRRQIPARVQIVSGTELDEESVVERAIAGCHGLIVIRPAGGTVNQYGGLIQALYDVKAFRLESKDAQPQPDANRDGGAAPPTQAPAPPKTALRALPVWRGRVDLHLGGSSNAFGIMVAKLMVRLIDEGVLPGTPVELPSEPFPVAE